MADYWDNFTLGLAGVQDLVEHAVGIDSTAAADVYADQTAEAQGLDQVQAQQLQSNAEAAETNDKVIEKSAKQTANQVAAAAVSGSKWLLIGGAALLVVVSATVLVVKLS